MSETKAKNCWQKVLFGALAEKNASRKIAYIAVITAIVVVANMFEFKLAETQFSLTIFVSAIAGILIGPVFGFAAGFLGDLVGFLYNSSGFAYLPWIGLSLGAIAFLSGLIVGGLRSKSGAFLYVKLSLVCVLTFLLCTVAINTTAFWLLYSKVDYWTYLVSRLFVQGQIWNSLVNYVLLFIAVPALNKIKPLKLYIR
ncbi:MAG: ECF transporter S component [Clostridia bacterium]|nr:ECF transporter S component [Clostridia bacterium]